MDTQNKPIPTLPSDLRFLTFNHWKKLLRTEDKNSGRTYIHRPSIFKKYRILSQHIWKKRWTSVPNKTEPIKCHQIFGHIIYLTNHQQPPKHKYAPQAALKATFLVAFSSSTRDALWSIYLGAVFFRCFLRLEDGMGCATFVKYIHPLKTNMEPENIHWKRRNTYKPPIVGFHCSMLIFRGVHKP